MRTWKLSYNKLSPDEENLREALCTLGNGYFGTRGAAPETAATRIHYPGTYIAGVYNSLSSEVAGRTILNEDFVNCPNWLMFNYRIDDEPWFNRLNVKILTWKMELNMRKGMLSRRVRWQDNNGRITLVENHRIVSMSHPHCGALVCTITPENYSGKITMRSGLDGLIINAGVDRYKQLNSRHLEPHDHGTFGEDGIYLQMLTNQSKIQITEAQRTLCYKNHEQIKPKLNVIAHGRQRIIQECTFDLKENDRITVEKLVSIYTSRDHGVTDDCQAAQETASSIENFSALYKPHQAKWKALWKRFDVKIEGDDFVQLALRLHAFHLLQSASTYNEDIDAGMTARGLHGEAYRGHIFWDELYIFPFFNLHAPEITRALLMYRYRRLGAAKDNAQEIGLKGAMYPWQSASLGNETSQIIHINPMSNTWGPDYSSLQRHVSIAIAYNVWTYFYTSGDRDFLDRYGAEMILEIAHFWSSLAEYNEKTQRYEINGVMGPDEFHEKYPAANKGGLNNNTYTNVMVVWILQKAIHILDEMLIDEDKNALLLKTGVNDKEIERWKNIAQKMTVVMDKNGLLHQFEGYMELEELDWDGYRQSYDNIHRVDRILKAEGLSPDSYKVAKQADTLMLFYVLNDKEISEIFSGLGYKLPKNFKKINFDYYFPRTSHGSTLSLVVHAYIAHLCDDNKDAEEYLGKALESDIYDTQGGTTKEGIHAGVMASTIDTFLRMCAGLSISEDRICLDPGKRTKWKKISFNIRFKNTWFNININNNKVTITATPLGDTSLPNNNSVPIQIKNKIHQLTPGKSKTVSL